MSDECPHPRPLLAGEGTDAAPPGLPLPQGEGRGEGNTGDWRPATAHYSPPAAHRLAELAAAVQTCRRCQTAGLLAQAEPRLLGLAYRLKQGAAASASSQPRLVVVGQAPSRHAAAFPEPFTSPFARTIARWLVQAGFPEDSLPQRVHLTALTRCFPGPAPSGSGDRAPSRAEIALCSVHLHTELAALRPRAVLAVGKLAIDTLHGRSRPLSAVIGSAWERDGVRFLPLPHPSGRSRWHNDPAHRALVDAAVAQLAAWRVELGL